MIDSHCHLDHEPLFNNIDEVLKRSKDVGIEKLLTICTTFDSFEKIKLLVSKDDIKLEDICKNEFLIKGNSINKIDILFKKIEKNND